VPARQQGTQVGTCAGAVRLYNAQMFAACNVAGVCQEGSTSALVVAIRMHRCAPCLIGLLHSVLPLACHVLNE
jgi:hypothetical protein